MNELNGIKGSGGPVFKLVLGALDGMSVTVSMLRTGSNCKDRNSLWLTVHLLPLVLVKVF